MFSFAIVGLRDYSPYLALHTGKVLGFIIDMLNYTENESFAQYWISGNGMEWTTSEDTSMGLQSLPVK